MDPNEAVRLVFEPGIEPEIKRAALDGLINWIRNDGFIPELTRDQFLALFEILRVGK